MNPEIFKLEQEHLTQVYDQLAADHAELTAQIAAATEAGVAAKSQLAGDVRLNFDSFADNVDTFAAIETANREIDGRNSQLASMEHRHAAAEILLAEPYFARVDLRYAGEDDDEPIYIGKVGYATKLQEDLVYDWRAPVGDVYYAGKFGQVTYQAGGRTIPASLKLRRQFVLKANELMSFVDSQLATQDPLLLTALAQTRDSEMRDITATIQSEQNAVIRNTTAQVLIVDGVAGSGKTSVLLQRVAYQLFRNRGTWRSADVLLLTPSKMFTHYTSAVLPALGETNPQQVPFVQYLQQLGRRFGFAITAADVGALDVAAIEKLLQTVGAQGITPRNLGERHNVTEAFNHTDKAEPLAQRLQTAYLALNRQNNALTPQDWVQWVAGQKWLRGALDNSASQLYIWLTISRYTQRNIRALFVDEAQDYSAAELAIIAKVFGHAEITLLGDHDQTLETTAAPFLTFGTLLPRVRTEVVHLQTSYRATAGITQYFAQFANRGDLTIGAVQPDTTAPTELHVMGLAGALAAVKDALSQFTFDRSCAVIVPDADKAEVVADQLNAANIPAAVVEANAPLIGQDRIAVVPLTLAKGLEFDAAYVLVDSAYYPQTVLGAHRMYVATSRATKQLTVLRIIGEGRQ